MDYGT
jgi:hypothetical protein